MKKTIFTLFVALSCFCASYGQSNDGTERKHIKAKGKAYSSAMYVVLSTGLNNNIGLAGISLDIPVSDHVSVEGGLGLSTWGYKFYGGGKYFLQPYHLGWAFGAGVTYNTGLADFSENMATTSGYTEPVELQLNPQANLVLAAYRYWRLGRGGNRIYMELGYSVRLTSGDVYTQLDNGSYPLDNTSDGTIKILAPGGLIAAVGFSFGIN